MARGRVRSCAVAAACLAPALFALAVATPAGGSRYRRHHRPDPIHKIRHVVIVMQENRSFDEYFGTFPGANGLRRDGHGRFTACIPDPRAGHCQRSTTRPTRTPAARTTTRAR